MALSTATAAGIYKTGHGKFRCIQIMSMHDLFSSKKPEIPSGHPEGFKKAPKESEGN